MLERLLALVLVALGVAVAALAWRHGLPANGVIGALTALAAGWWLVRAEPATADVSPPVEADSIRLDDERRRRTLQAFLDQAPTPLVTLEPGGQLAAVNRAARRLFRTDNVLPDGDGALLAAIGGGAAQVRRTVRLASEGVSRTYALSVAEVVGAGGALRLAALTDIEAELQAAEAAALKQLLQVLSHEIMNSLTPLASLAHSAAELLEEGDRQDVATARESVAVIARRTDSLNRFVEAYRTLARLPAPAPRRVSLGDLLAEAARLFESRWGSEGVVLVLQPPSPDILIDLDPDLTGQALLGLLTNAAEAARSGGRAPPTVAVSARPLGGGGAVVTVRDNGPGVPADRAEAIFQPFFTTKRDGSGVGLSLARQAIVSQGGQLNLDPGDESGASFTMAF